MSDSRSVSPRTAPEPSPKIFVDRDGCEWRLIDDDFEFRDDEERDEGENVWTPAKIEEWTSRTNNVEHWRYWLGFFGSMVRE